MYPLPAIATSTDRHRRDAGISRCGRLLRPLGGLLAGWAMVSLAGAEPLPPLGIDRTAVTVSGLSSGGYMAVQLLVAYSGTFSGAAVIAAGPYDCAEGNVEHASRRCLGHGGEIPVERLAALTRARAAAGSIDPLSALARARVYLFSGRRDSVVPTAVTDALQRYLLHFLPATALRYRKDIDSEHGMVTDGHGSACGHKGSPYINDCAFDLAGELLAFLYGPLQPRNEGPLRGRFVSFDQPAWPRDHGLAPSGRLFVPADCERAGAHCRLHLAFHGCGQNVARLGERYVRETGYNRWADTNHIVVLYPQTGATAPNGCWDWYGYSGQEHALRSGPQMAAVHGFVERLAGTAGACHHATLWEHLLAGRLYLAWGMAYASGSGEALGGFWPTRRLGLRQTGPARYERTSCPATSRP
ncbi:extracellular catalytic domain type 2 short-chain-length polyhydroxyalkanoate depolymerase [Eleftheria terrae]|uniref:extracellular catalytic domain type 2 short-chain-length polyhydroxyalkanoate depolymerase n=1 Tax=Eleftheria terrae TaxID=1597781 RepID=UPI00263AB5D1|nr:PHB depolymerase family esterase [Eleftheria terrae]WKB52474.1 PHA-depolymerase-like protein [Eleftheria terrae]